MSEEVKTAEFVEVTWARASRVWWSLFWRTVLFTFLGGFIVSSVLGFLLAQAGVDPETTFLVCQTCAFIVGIPIGILITGVVLGKRFPDFRIVLVKEEPAVREGSYTSQ